MRLFLLGFLAMALVACGSDAEPTADENKQGDETKQGDENKGTAQPFQRSEQCASTFKDEPLTCTSTSSSIEQPATALPEDFPPMPASASYCGGSRDTEGTVGLEWSTTGLPDELQTYFSTELAARGYRPTAIERATVRNCAEAISFSSATHSGFIAFSPGAVQITISTLPLK